MKKQQNDEIKRRYKKFKNILLFLKKEKYKEEEFEYSNLLTNNLKKIIISNLN